MHNIPCRLQFATPRRIASVADIHSGFKIAVDRISLMKDEPTALGHSTWRRASTSSVWLSLASISSPRSHVISLNTTSTLTTRA